ncbi:MAG: phosphatase PAP2 family protein [Lachnospiraceae bacterium]|nr:phosphatase PAP2 family protein [Lachnospiraceae bacterium]
MLIYLPWFAWLEKTVTKRFHVIHMAIDDKIPFIEYFIIPYLLWFAYVAIAVLYFMFKNKEEYYRLCTFLFIGMTVFLIISTVYPNGHHLRPVEFARDNIFVDMVQTLYQADTSTNLFPSIHVYNSIGVNIAIWHCEEFRKNKAVRYGSATLMISIILATMFLKQHSVFDVITGIVFSIFMYTLVYTKSPLRLNRTEASLEKGMSQI